MNIRKYTGTDLNRIVEITRAAWGDNTLYKLLEDRHGIIDGIPWQDKKVKDIVNFCNEKPETVIVAEIDGIVAGYASYSIINTTGYVKNNAVAPEYQGKGIGSAMNKWIIENLKNNGVQIILVSTMEHDKAARRIYEKNGFNEISRTIEYSMDLSR